MAKIKHDGLFIKRLSELANNPREVTFAQLWKEENNANERRFLLQLLLQDELTQRDAEVAATVIQWLGSNVGMSFLTEACRRNPEIYRWLMGGYDG